MRKFFVLSVSLIMLNILWQKSLIAQEPCPETLMHYWRLEKIQQNTFTDYTGNLNADVLVNTTPILGKVDSAQSFTGSSKVDIPAHSSFDWSANSSFTIEFWVNKPDACPAQTTSKNNVILGRDDPASSLHWWTGISCTNPGKVAFNLYANNGNGHSIESNKAIIDTSWHLVALVRNGSENTTSIYIDGVHDTTVSHTFTDGFSSQVPVNMGWLNLGTNYYFNGKLDELALYDSILVDSVIAGHYNSGAGKAYCKTSSAGIDSSDLETDFYSLTMIYAGMDTAVGHEFKVRLIEVESQQPYDSLQISSVDSSAFAIVFDSLRNNSYIDFWVDLNDNGSYDMPSTDQAWRVSLLNVVSDTILYFTYNTAFTDIYEVLVDTSVTDTSGHVLTLDFSGFESEINHNMTIYLRNPDSNEFVDSLLFEPLSTGDFTVFFDSLESGDLHVDFYSDFNDNSLYDTPPVDHAWRIGIEQLSSDTTISVAHTLYFTDIFKSPDTVVVDSNYQVILNMTGFSDHVGKNLIVYLRDPVSGDFVDSVLVTPLENADFEVEFDSVEIRNYNIDFYFDMNGNGKYDVPPADHAWRIQLVNFDADTTITYISNTTYTDIGIVVIVGINIIQTEYFRAYPNPARNLIQIDLLKDANSISIYNTAGSLMIHKPLTPSIQSVKIELSSLKPGFYILDVKGDQGNAQLKFVKE